MLWLSSALDSVVGIFKSAVQNPNVQAATVGAVKDIATQALAHRNDPAALTEFLNSVADNAEKIVGAAFAGTPAQGLVDAAILPPAAK